MVPRLSYVVCASPRSGSSMLCAGLASTGIAGRPSEYFNPAMLDEMLIGIKLGLVEDSEYMEKMTHASTTENGVFGTKLHAFQTPFLMLKISQRRGYPQTSLRESIEREFPNLRYIYLRREDKVAQAVSYYRALRTGEWWRFEGKKPVEIGESAYYELGIRKLLNQVEASDTYWEGFFEKHKIVPLKLTFDDVTKDYENTVRRVLEFLDLDTSVRISPPGTRKISNELSEVWQQRFRNALSSRRDEVKVPKFWAPY